MKKCLIFGLILMALCALGAGAEGTSPWAFHSEVDLFLSMKVGAEYLVSDDFGIRGSLGACIISPTQISYTLVAISHFMPPARPLQVDLQYGLIQAVFDAMPKDNPYTYWVPGACVSFGYRSPRGHGFAVRGGAGALFGYDLGAWRGPFLQPNIGLEYSWRRLQGAPVISSRPPAASSRKPARSTCTLP
jgi:hypothetical protein